MVFKIWVRAIAQFRCYQFSRFKTEKQNNDIMVEAWGRFYENSKSCPTVMIYLDGEKLNYLIEEKGDYTFKIKQADNIYLEQKISVE